MHPDLQKLLDLQTKDLALLEVDLELRGLLDQLAALDAELERGRQDVETARRAAAGGTRRREELEAKVDGLRVLQERRRQRLELAKTSRELQALGSELELARSVLAKEESEWFRVAEQANDLAARADAAAARLAEMEATQEPVREGIESTRREVEERRSVALAERRAAAESVARPLLARYDRLRSVRATEVVVALRGNACGACFTAVPMSRRSHIRAGLLLDGCEACGVILYSDTEGSAE
jgi:predicted  nucleic acid-binding Zn-ribbon protein